MIKGKETYDTIQSSCARIFKDVNKIVENGFITIDENRVPVEMFLGSDRRCVVFIVLIFGFSLPGV